MSDAFGIGTAVGQIGSALISANASKKSAAAQFAYQSALQAQAAKLNYEYSEKTARNSPTWNRAGLESAGYNPMLAVQNSTSGANSNFTSAGQATAPDYAGAISQGVANAQGFQRLKNETTVAESATDKNIADADEAKARKLEILERLPWVSKKMKAEIGQLEGQAQLMEAQRHYMDEQVAIQQSGISVQQEANAISAIGKEEYADRAKRYKEWGEKHPYLRNVDETITRYFNGIGANVGANKKVK